jgi:hypothetical protein
MIPFLILLFIFLAVFIIVAPNEKHHKNIYIYFGIVLILTAGLRVEGLTLDYDNYLYAYYNSSDAASRFEPTFTIIAVFVKSTFNNPIFLFLIYAFLGVTIKFIAIKQVTHVYLLSALVYFSNLFLLHEMTQIRAGVAAGILLLCIKPLYERNLKKFLFLTVIAITFHYTALVILPLWFLNSKKINKKFIWLIPFAYILVLNYMSLGFLVEHIPIDKIQVLYALYKNEGGFVDNLNVFNLLLLSRIFISLILFYNIDKISKINKYAPVLLEIYILSHVFFILFSDIPALSFRISELLGVVEIILIPFLIYLFKGKRIPLFFPIGIGAVMLWLSLFYDKLIL